VPSDKGDERRPTPEEILARVMQAERHAHRGRLKVFLGFAAGVGKTYEMLNEANRRKMRGEDVVVGYVETHGRQGTQDQIGALEVIPRKKIEYRGAIFEEMDADAIIARHPDWVLVDELAHTNVPGSKNTKRWQDVEEILEAGIGVGTTVNVQHMESLNDTIHDITGVWVRETVPDSVIQQADEVKMVDITPQALINRLERGDIYKQDKVPDALKNWFREVNLGALREIALREIAHNVDEEVAVQRKDQRIRGQWAAHDRVMVCITPTQSSMRLVRRGWRMAERLDADISAVYVESRPIDEREKEILRNDFSLAERLGVPVETLYGDVATELIRYVREKQVTQMILGHSSHSRWHEFVYGSIINKLTRELRTIDILIVASSTGDM
jgi:two-component system sensor histidine kinase KdpD